MFGQGMLFFLQKLLIADGKAHPHLSINQIDHFVIFLEEQVLEDQEQLIFSQGKYSHATFQLSKRDGTPTVLSTSPHLFLHLYQPHFVSYFSDFRLHSQRILLNQLIHLIKFFVDLVPELVVALEDQGAVEDLDIVNIRQQKLQNLQFIVIQFFLALYVLADLHDFELSQVSKKQVGEGEGPLPSWLFLVHYAQELIFSRYLELLALLYCLIDRELLLPEGQAQKSQEGFMGVLTYFPMAFASG